MHDQGPSQPAQTQKASSRTPALSGRPPASAGGGAAAGGGISREAHQISPRPSAPSAVNSSPASAIKSNIRNILLANPLFPKFYADVVISSNPNSQLAKILRALDPKILEKVKSNMSSSICTHIKITGVRCGSPSLRGEQFCYFHQRMHRGVRTPPQARLHPIALIEDEESIQAALMEVINALMRNTIDLKRATLILRALHIAVKNAQRVKFNAGREAVREVPEYAGQTTPLSEQAAIHEAMNIPRYDPAGPPPPRLRTSAELIRDGVVHRPPDRNVGADAFVRPGPAQPVRDAVPSKSNAAESAPAHLGTAPQACPERAQRAEGVRPGGPYVSVRSAVESAVAQEAGKKPPASVKPAPEKRKTAAQGG